MGTSRTTAKAHIALASCALLHVLLVLYFVRGVGAGPANPDVFAGWGLEVYRVARARLSHELGFGLATYDPLTLAGQRAGLVEPLGTRLFVYASLVLPRFVGGPVPAMTAVVRALAMLFPFVGYAAAALGEVPARARTLAFALFSALFFFDSLVHGAWGAGRLAWVFGSALVLLTLVSLHRALRGGSVATSVLAACAGVLAAIVHPVSGLLCAALGALEVLSFGGVPFPRRLGPLLAAASPLGWFLASPVKLAGALSSEPVATGWTGSVAAILWDLLEVPGPGAHGPGAVRTLFRSSVLVAGLVGLVRYHREEDSRRRAVTPLVTLGLALGHLGQLWRGPWPLDPPLFLVPAALGLTLPASEVLAEIPWVALTVGRGLPGKALLAATLALVAPRLVRTVGTYVPELLPVPVVRAPGDTSKSSLVGLFEPMPDSLAYAPAPRPLSDLASFLAGSVEGGRVLALDPEVAALLTVTTPLDVLGPISERGALSAAADPSPLLRPDATQKDARAYLERYAVSWVVLPLARSVLDGDGAGLGETRFVSGRRVRRVLEPTGLVLEGEATVAERRLGLIRVQGASGSRVTLRIHHDPALACRPGCLIEKRATDFDPAGFLSVPEPPPEFELYLR